MQENPSTIVLMMPVTMNFLAGSLVCDGKDRTVAFRLRRAVSTSLFVLIPFSSSANCRRKSEANYPAHFPFAYVQEGCGPADGPALLFYFTVKPAKCGKYGEPFLLIQIIGNLPKSASHAYAMGSGSRDSSRRAVKAPDIDRPQLRVPCILRSSPKARMPPASTSSTSGTEASKRETLMLRGALLGLFAANPSRPSSARSNPRRDHAFSA